MNNMIDLYHIQLEKLCRALELGKLTTTPEPITGGLLHKMFAVETVNGKYAIKMLNPQIMARPTARSNYIQSEKIVQLAAKHIPAQPARIYNGTFLQNIDHQWYIVFDWLEGQSLQSHEITIDHCMKMGAILADIHNIDFSAVENRDDGGSHTAERIDWHFYLDKGRELRSVWVELLSANMEKIVVWNNKAVESSNLLASERVYSHRDLDPKNVLWKLGQPIVIDWESAGAINPKQDFLETAVYWSADGRGEVEQERLFAFASGYQKHAGAVRADWRTVLELGCLSKLEWLEYSLKRSLQLECTDEAEQVMGTNHVIETIHSLRQYEEMMAVLESWLNQINDECCHREEG